MKLLLWPTPKNIEFLGDATFRIARNNPIEMAPDASIPPEGYILTVLSSGMYVRFADEAGLRHARATIEQLWDQETVRCRIEDAPDYPVRGIMLDVSRSRIPTMDQLFQLVDNIAAHKGNHLQLYIEHSVAYVGHESVWTGSSPITFDELRQLDAYAKERFIQLGVNQNTLGHAERWLKHPNYADLGEFTDVAQRLEAGEPGPFSFCPIDARVGSLCDDLLQQQMSAISGAWVHIGGDETVDIGQGRSREAVERLGMSQVWSEFMAQRCQLITKAGRKPLYWSDMALEFPDAIDRLPSEAVAVAWHYEADAPFEHWAQIFREKQRNWWVSPGTSAWRSWVGRGDARQGCIAGAANAGLRGGASGFLMTEWGDLGHRQPWPVGLFGLFEGLGAAWNANAAQQPDYQALGHCILEDQQLGPWLDRVSRIDTTLRLDASHPIRQGPLINSNVPFIDSCLPYHEVTWQADPADWQVLYDEYAKVKLPQSSSTMASELQHGLDAVSLATRRALLRRTGHAASTLHDEWLALSAEHARQWLKRCRPGGLSESCAFYEALAEGF